MSCDRLPMVQHLAVEQPEALTSVPWSEHLEKCMECRAERRAFDRSLAVFRQVEGDRLRQLHPGPAWEEFSRILEQRQGPRTRRFRARLPLSMAAAAGLLAAVVSAVMLWPSAITQEAPLSNLVTIDPEEQYRLDGAPPGAPPRNAGQRGTRVIIRSTPVGLPRTPGSPAPAVRQTIPVGNSAPVMLFRSLRQRTRPPVNHLGLKVTPFEPPPAKPDEDDPPANKTEGLENPALTTPAN